MFTKVDRDESLLWFVANDYPTMASRWGVELSLQELHDFKECERKYFEWQNRIDSLLECPRKGAKGHKIQLKACKKRR
jgi:hypothetical protein